MNWTEENSSLTRRFEFANFAEALSFVNSIGKLAEEYNHHPDISFGWGYAEISLTSHDAGGVTDRDRRLAEAIDQLLSSS